MKISQWLQSYGAYKNVWKNQRGITWKLRKGEQSFLYATRHSDLIHIPINLHEDIINGNWIMARTRMFTDIRTDRQMDGGQTAPCYNMSTFIKMGKYTVIKVHQYLPIGYQGMSCTRFGGTIILVCDTSSWPNTYSYKIAWRYPEWLLSWGTYKKVDGRTDSAMP